MSPPATTGGLFLFRSQPLEELRSYAFSVLTPAPPNVSCVAYGHLSPLGPSPCPCPGVDTSSSGWLRNKLSYSLFVR